MKQKIIHLTLLASALLGIAPAFADQYTISRFRDAVSDFDRYQSMYQSARAGSFEEMSYNQFRRTSASEAKSLITQYDAFTNLRASETESLLLEFQQAYQSASGGSLREDIFNVARRAASEGLKTNAIAEIQYAYSSEGALQSALEYTRKYQSASGGSLLESTYNTIRTSAFEIAKQKLQEEAYRIYDFRQAESLFVSYQSGYQSASGGSKTEDFYNVARRLMHSRALELFRGQAPQMSYYELSSIQSEYDSRYRSASGGSLAESLYRSIRDEARIRLSGAQIPPQPMPQPYPQPYPQPQPIPSRNRCEIREGGNSYGQRLFRVVDQAGRILLTTSSPGQAQQFIRTDARCR